MIRSNLASQDFHTLRRQCHSNNKLFTDPHFPPENESLFYRQKSPVKIVWRRPPDFTSDPKLMVDGASRFDVTQGMLGDCWLLSAMASLAQKKSLLRVVVPEDQSFDKQYAGIFHFRLWHFGEWVDVVVDDYLPTYNNQLVFAHSPERNEIWPALLEKAYAKLHGSYEALKGGRTSEAMEDFTGGVQEVVDIARQRTEKDLFSLVNRAMLRSGLISCSIRTNSSEQVETKLDNGLIAGHAYTVTDARRVRTRQYGTLDMVRVRNPWGNEREWKGAWSDNSPQWRSVSQEERNNLELTFSDDGEFWMSFADFQKEFSDLEICHSSIDDLDEDQSIESWNLATFSGSWSKRKGTAGGCRNYPTFCNNPQICIELSEDADGDGKCSVIIALMQKDCRAQKCLGFQSSSIGFSIYKQTSSSTPLNKNFFNYNRSVANSGSLTNLREVSARFDLLPGQYTIIPCIFEPLTEGEFILRVFTEKYILHPNRDPAAETEPNAVEDISGSSGKNVSANRLRIGEQMFIRMAGSDGRVDAEELMDILTAALSRDLTKCVLERDTCRALIQLVDRDRAGSLNCEQCLMLIGYIGRWKSVFKSTVESRSQTISKHELSLALQELGYDLSPECLDVIINRFSTQDKINIQDFIAIVCRVKMLSDIFKVKHDPKKKSLTFSQETFLLNSLKL